MSDSVSLIPAERIEHSILLIRGHKVMLDSDLAKLYGVPTKVLLQSIRRNARRFPSDFMFQLTAQEFDRLRSQIVTSNARGGRRYRPHVFTEQGVAMLSSVLNSDRAIEVNIAIMRAFVKLRELLATNKDLARRMAELEKKYDAQFQQVFHVLRLLTNPPVKRTRRKIGFRLN